MDWCHWKISESQSSLSQLAGQVVSDCSDSIERYAQIKSVRGLIWFTKLLKPMSRAHAKVSLIPEVSLETFVIQSYLYLGL